MPGKIGNLAKSDPKVNIAWEYPKQCINKAWSQRDKLFDKKWEETWKGADEWMNR